MGTRVMFSTPPAMTHSYCPAITPIAAKFAACWPGPAHAIEGGAADVEREPRDQRGVARDIEPLLAHLVDAADHHVLDLGGIDLHALDERLERVGQQVVRANPGERAALLSHGGPHRPHDHRVCSCPVITSPYRWRAGRAAAVAA